MDPQGSSGIAPDKDKQPGSRQLWQPLSLGLLVSCIVWLCSPLVADAGAKTRRWRMTLLPPASFSMPAHDLACFRMVKREARQTPLWSSRYPRTIDEAVQWLQRAHRKGTLIFPRGAILGQLQQEIDKPRRGRLHLLFGNNHSVVEHYRFFNDLLHPGKDGIQLTGLTHLALEAFVTEPNPRRLTRRQLSLLRRTWSVGRQQLSPKQQQEARAHLATLIESDQQRLLDLYLRKKQSWAYHFIQVVSHYLLGSAYSPDLLQEMLATLKYASQSKGKLRVLATDMSLRMRKRSSRLACWLYSLREIFGLYAVNRAATSRKDVIAYMWGSHHIRKDHFPRFIPPTETVYSVRMQGGGIPDIWDHALARLHLPMKMFAIVTPGARESDMMIHFPPKGPWLAGKLKFDNLSMARLIRQPQQPFPRPPPMYYRSYRAGLAKALNGLQYPLLQCYRRGRYPLTLRLMLNSAGRIVRIRFAPTRKRVLGWSRSCIRRRLWRLALLAPPQRIPIEVTFKLRYQRK